ncbi:MAG: NTP transferase domain-containing protein [Epsilonproteobacteria bacterium]|nr:NTP transferase domain-containing protein [Campylobacterota bacterium]
MKAIILTGGFGTRLQSVVKDVPKPMADINGKPFLAYLFEKLMRDGVTEVVLSVGYKKEVIQDYFKDHYKTVAIKYSQEFSPLGTGGAIKKALSLYDASQKILVLNGDTFYNLNTQEFYNKAISYPLSIALKPMKNFERYGSVTVENSFVTSFQEKTFVTEGLINAGVYVVTKNLLENIETEVFSFETFLEKQNRIYAYIEDCYFVDIGVPKDYKKAQIDFKEMF